MPKPTPTPEELLEAKCAALRLFVRALEEFEMVAAEEGHSDLVIKELRVFSRDLRKRLTALLAPAKPSAATERGYAFADWFKTLLPAETRLSDTWRDSWAKCYDQLIIIDQRTPEDIARVCRWGRTDAFWCRNFLSPLKLRQRDDGGVFYFDRFLQRMKPIGRPSGPAAGQYAESDAPLPTL